MPSSPLYLEDTQVSWPQAIIQVVGFFLHSPITTFPAPQQRLHLILTHRALSLPKPAQSSLEHSLQTFNYNPTLLISNECTRSGSFRYTCRKINSSLLLYSRLPEQEGRGGEESKRRKMTLEILSGRTKEKGEYD